MKARLSGWTATSLVAGAFAVLVACSSDSPTAPPQNQPPPGPSRVVLTNPAFGTNIQEIFDRTGCSAGSCHGASPGASSLNLSTGASYAQLVNVQANQAAGEIRVIPNMADSSYLVKKILPNPPVGLQMPRNGTALDTIDVNNIRNWINTGAPNN